MRRFLIGCAVFLLAQGSMLPASEELAGLEQLAVEQHKAFNAGTLPLEVPLLTECRALRLKLREKRVSAAAGERSRDARLLVEKYSRYLKLRELAWQAGSISRSELTADRIQLSFIKNEFSAEIFPGLTVAKIRERRRSEKRKAEALWRELARLTRQEAKIRDETYMRRMNRVVLDAEKTLKDWKD